MQSQILAFFILTSVALGVLGTMQWREVRQQRASLVALREQAAQQVMELDGRAASLRALERETQRMRDTLLRQNEDLSQMREATNQLAAALAAAQSKLAAGESEAGQAMLGAWHWYWLDDAAQQWLPDRQTNRVREAVLPGITRHEWFGQGSNVAARALAELTPRARFPSQVGDEWLRSHAAECRPLRESLGDRSWAALEAFIGNLPERIFLWPYYEGLRDTPMTISDEHYDQLVNLVASTRRQVWQTYVESTHSRPDPAVGFSAGLWTALLDALREEFPAQAGLFLKSEQLEEFTRFLGRQEQWIQAGRDWAAALAGPPE